MKDVAPRYATIVAILDDPLNRACVERELARRAATHKLIPPPIRKTGGGLLYVPMRLFQRKVLREIKDSVDTPYLFDLFQGTEGWFVQRGEDAMEFGPFDTLHTAKKEAESLLQGMGYKVLDTPPWGQAEVDSYPLRGGRESWKRGK